MFDLLDNVDSLYNEAYFGKSNGILEIEKCMGDILKQANASKYKNLNGDKDLLQLRKAIQRQFGFGEVFMRLAAVGSTGTIVNSHVIFCLDKNVDISVNLKNGYYDKFHKDKIFIRLNVPEMINSKLTAAEATAVILHEIGHNMDYSAYTGLYLLGNIVSAWSTQRQMISQQAMMTGILSPISPVAILGTALISEIMSSPYTKRFMSIATSIPDMIVQNIPPINILGQVLSNSFRPIGKGLHVLLSPIQTLTIPLCVLMSPLNNIMSMWTHKREQYADSFAASYGYSEELVSALGKVLDMHMRFTNDIILEIPLFRFMIDLTAANLEIMQIFTTPHGSGYSRMYTILTKLKKDLADKDFLPAERAELVKEIDRLEFMVNTHQLATDDDKLAILRFTRSVIYKYTGSNPNITDKISSSNLM